MSPAEHYAKAEHLIKKAHSFRHMANQRELDEIAPGLPTHLDQRREAHDRLMREAQVHATLAMATDWPAEATKDGDR